MKSKTLKLPPLYLLLLPLCVALLGAGCDKNEIPEEIRTAEDYIGKYSGQITRLRMAPNGFITLDVNAFVEKIPTEVEITKSNKGDNLLMVYVSAYKDSILCELDESTGYIWILDEAYSFYLRTSDFPEFKGFYDDAVSTYGDLGYRETDNVTTFQVDYLKDFNDSTYICNTATIKIN